MAIQLVWSDECVFEECIMADLQNRPPKRVSDVSEDQLRKRYKELSALRETQPERECAAARSALEKTVASSETLVTSLRTELAQLKRSAPDAQSASDELARAKAAAEQLQEENGELQRRLAAAEAVAETAAEMAAAPAPSAAPSAAQQAVLGFYEMMTGMSVEVEGSAKKARCVVSAAGDEGGEARRAVFELDLAPADGEAEDVEYVPTDLTGCADRLPEYLRESIMCTRVRAAPARRPRARHLPTHAPNTRFPCARSRALAGARLHAAAPRRHRGGVGTAAGGGL